MNVGAPLPLYRRTEVVASDKGEYQYASLDHGYGSVMTGELAFGWNSVPDSVSEVLSKIVTDVAYVGNSDSTVIVSWEEITNPTHTRGSSRDEYHTSGVLTLECPSPGRLEELRSRYLRMTVPPVRPAKLAPCPTQDQANTSRKMASEHIRDYRRNISPLTLVPAPNGVPQNSEVPWNKAVWVPLDRDVPNHMLARVAGDIHRALVKVSVTEIGEAPPCLSGKHPGDKPPNNVAVQFIPSGTTVRHSQWVEGLANSGLLVLIPRDAEELDAAAVSDAVFAARLNGVFSNKANSPLGITAGSPVQVDPSRWWAGAPHGYTRQWRTHPLAVAERVVGSPRSLAALSVLHAFRGLDGAAEAKVTGARRFDIDNVTDYVHRVWQVGKVDRRFGYPRRFTTDVRLGAYTATLDLSTVLPDTAVSAIGQSRHFGTGLLIPEDVSETD
jgi:CRISPR-associated protein Csb2